MNTKRIAACLAASGIMVLAACGQDYTNKSTCLDGAGDWSTGGGYTNISAIAQPGGVGVSAGGDYMNYAGFLGTFSLKGGDMDNDGVDNEADADNDGDGLDDYTEVAGDAFSPLAATDHNLADSDGDGVIDGDEAGAQTNPNDSNAFLRITSIAKSGADKELKWVARSNVSYRIRSTDGSMSGRPTDILDEMTVTTPGTGTWQVAEGTYADTLGDTNARFYAIEPVQ